MFEEDALFFMKWAVTTFLAQIWIFANIRKTGAGPQHTFGDTIYDLPGNPLRSTWWAWTFGIISTLSIFYIFGFKLSEVVVGYITQFGLIAQVALFTFCVTISAIIGVYYEFEKNIDELFWISIAISILSGLVFIQAGYSII